MLRAALLLSIALLPDVARAQCTSTVTPSATRIELTPADVGSIFTNVFSTLPTLDPSLFGLDGADVRGVNFDVDPNGTALTANSVLTNQYASIGVDMNSIRIDNNVYQGPASPPNATEHNLPQIFTFTEPVAAVGIINTSPDHDHVELWSGPNATGQLLLAFDDQDGVPLNFNIDRFVGGRACPGFSIGSFVVSNAGGDLELDELIFEVLPPPPPVDAGAPEDAGDPEDAGEPDADPLDAEAPDAISAEDAEVPPEAGALDAGDDDAGEPPDADAIDSSAEMDAGVANDAGTPTDAGTPNDAGVSSDAGSARDATLDAGFEPEDGEGCDCGATRDHPRSGAWTLLALLALLRRRSSASNAVGRRVYR